MDLDQCGMMAAFAKGVDLSPGTDRRWTRSSRTGRASTSWATAHTLANFESAFFRSSIADNNSFEQWEIEGSADSITRANTIWKKMLAEYEAPAIDESVDEELRSWIEQKKASFPDSNV